MAVKCGWASSDEYGRAHGGRAGDQNSREVKTGQWYDFGQTAVYRWKSRKNAKRYAAIIESFCDNKNVGYDQIDRMTLGTWCAKHDWDYHVDTPVETDCSKMTGDGINCTMKKQLIPNDVYTGNLDTYLMRTGMFMKLTGSKYCDTDKNLMVGDIINNPARHVITALQNGSNIKDGWRKELGKWHYYEDNTKLRDGWAKDSQGWCYLNKNGDITKNKWVKWKNDWYYLQKDGYMAENRWAKDSQQWCYLGSDGKMVKDKWVKDKDNWYYLGSDGRMVTNDWRKDTVGWCWLNNDGKMARNHWLKWKGSWYYLKSDGHMATGKRTINGKEFTFSKDGKLEGDM